MSEQEESEEAQADRLFKIALDALERLSEEMRSKVLANGHLVRLITALAPLKAMGENAYDYLLAHKTGLCMLAQVRQNIHNSYSFSGTVDNQHVFVSPDVHQWYEDGVMFLQGREPFQGLVGLYQNGRLKFAVAARAAQAGELLGRDDFLFLDLDELKKRPPESLSSQPLSRQAITELQHLLDSRETGEDKYQEYFRRFPWVLGAQFRSVESHTTLDNHNIPDFTGVRLRDGSRDLLEIKSPFLNLFRSNGEFAAQFNDAWNQAERYLDFCRREADYLRRQQNLSFENPHCYLLIGYCLSGEQLSRFRAKERMNPAITVLTYDDVLTLAQGTVELLSAVYGDQREGT